MSVSPPVLPRPPSLFLRATAELGTVVAGERNHSASSGCRAPRKIALWHIANRSVTRRGISAATVRPGLWLPMKNGLRNHLAGKSAKSAKPEGQQVRARIQIKLRFRPSDRLWVG